MSNVKGLNQLSEQLAAFGTKMGGKALRQSVAAAVKPTVNEMKARAPVSSGGAHKTYLGRTVAPGFLRRSIKTRTTLKNGRAEVHVGVAPEAFYGVNFIDQGITVSSRRGKHKGEIKPYTIKGRKWFKFVFLKNEQAMIKKLNDTLALRIKKLTT